MAISRRTRHIQPKKRSFRWVTCAVSVLLIVALAAMVFNEFPSAGNSSSAGGQSTKLPVPQGGNPWSAFR